MSGFSCDRSRRVLSVLCLLALLMVTTVVASCGSSPPSGTYQQPKPADYSKMTWTNAFEALHKKYSSEYAFTAWKSINWKKLHDTYAPLIKKAQAANDAVAYETALRSYVLSVPDGHVSFHSTNPAPLIAAVGGGFGFAVTGLSDGSVAATWVKAGGPAAAAGMQPGAKIVSWGGKPVAQALKATPTI